MAETFGCVAAFAERFGTRPHILCRDGKAGLTEALTEKCAAEFLTEDEARFEMTFVKSIGRPPLKTKTIDRSPDVLAPDWERALHLVEGAAVATTATAIVSSTAAVLDELRTRLAALDVDPDSTTTATSYWAQTARNLAKLAATSPIDEFLTWTTDVDQTELAIFHTIYDALQAHPLWESRWKPLSRKAPGIKVHACSRDIDASPITMQHAYHLMRFEDASGSRFIENLDAIVEFGGAHGNFARMLRQDGFRGTHYIIDLPHVLEFARAYLQLCGIHTSMTPTPIDGVVLLTERYIEPLIQLLAGKRVGFVATFSLSETPLALRAKLFPALHSVVTKHIITSQWPTHQTDPDISNEAYFTQFVRESGRAFKIEGHPNWTSMRYLLGFPGKAGTHVSFYDNNLAPEQPHHMHGGTARRYWAHERILVGGSIMNAEDSVALRALGITNVLSAEHEHDDAGKWPDVARARYEFDDDGKPVPLELLHKAMDYAQTVLAEPTAVLYTHCRLGGSRGPSMAYLTLRVGCAYDPARAMAAIRATREPHWTPHLDYIKSIERAITSRGGKPVDEALAYRRTVEAYRNTPTPVPGSKSIEQHMAQEDLAENRQPLPPEFGSYLSLLRGALCVGGSEFGLGLMLMSLTASIRAANIAEIGRFRGFSTLALAAGLALADAGWREPLAARQRPDIDYNRLLNPRKRRLVSIDPSPTPEADALIAEAGLTRYVREDRQAVG